MPNGGYKMIQRYYECYFKSDVVLPASSNTQGNIALSDFIAGSNFLGMVAKNYESFKDDSFDVFHSGAVKFGDAHLTIDNKPSYKIPLSFHKLKIGTGIFNRLHLSDTDEQTLRENQQQLKQLRDGFISEDFTTKTPKYNYTQKSSYDKENRHSKDGGMFGYSAFQGSTKWIFKVTYKDERYIAKVEENLLGSKKLGKSKTAQYGDVIISSIDKPATLESFTPKDDITYLYINSRVALIDEDANPTLTPTIKNLGLNSGEIYWKKTFLQTSTYTPYNYKRQTHEYTRLCINKGSVIAIKGLQDTLATSFYVGAFLSEGFGEVVLNPSFLKPKNPLLKQEIPSPRDANTQKADTTLLNYLKAKDTKEDVKFEVAKHTQEVYKSLLKPSKSQWGEIRSFASTSTDVDELKQKITHYITHGKAKKQWEGIQQKLFYEIDRSSSPLEFTRLLAMIASKHTKGLDDE